jgi:hypothetical protein
MAARDGKSRDFNISPERRAARGIPRGHLRARVPPGVRSRRERRPRPKTRGEDAQAVDQRRARALEEPLDVQLRSATPYPLLEVRNPLHETRYLVMLPEFPRRDAALCTCTDFARRGLGTCKHIEAGFRWRTDHPEAPSLRPPGPRWSGAALWRAIDQRNAAALRGNRPESVRWRRAGAVLFEHGPGE